MGNSRLTYGDLLKLKRWNTPTIYNGWEQIAGNIVFEKAFNLEEARDFMPPSYGPDGRICGNGCHTAWK